MTNQRDDEVWAILAPFAMSHFRQSLMDCVNIKKISDNNMSRSFMGYVNGEGLGGGGENGLEGNISSSFLLDFANMQCGCAGGVNIFFCVSF